MPDEQRTARDAGFDDVLVKPCLPDDVLRAVERLLSSRRSQLAPG
jgi:DNA-binding response OmpR family regulator